MRFINRIADFTKQQSDRIGGPYGAGNSVEASKECRVLGLIVLPIAQMDGHGSLSDPTCYPQNNQNVKRSRA